MGIGFFGAKMSGKKRRSEPKRKDEDGEEMLIFSGDEDESYDVMSKMGFICMEEITGEEAGKYLKKAPVKELKAEIPSKKPEVKAKEVKTVKEVKDKKPANKTVKVDKKAENEPLVVKEKKAVTLKEGEMKDWRGFGISEQLLLGFKSQDFTSPTPIQSQALEKYFKEGHRDILGAAPTGSGKTLAFGLPILNAIANEEADEGGLKALIIVPTRELALQIKQHLEDISGHLKDPLRLAILIGGMSEAKQQRLLSRNPHVIIGTPGRIASTLDDVGHEKLALAVGRLPFLVIDEADRMVEAGHFKDLDAILARVYANSSWKKRSTFLFSATLNNDVDANKKILDKRGHVVKTTMDQLKAKIKFCTDPVSISISTAHRVAERISISKLYCLPDEKDQYLVNVLLARPQLGKVLVFVNSIEILKRVAPVVELFGMPVIVMHAHQQQRQRLTNLDKFKAATGMVLVTSDVAARGLDIEKVDLVIHYHLPHQVDTFVHRSGRTGRGKVNSGAAIALISPQEVELEAKIVKHLKMTGKELPDHPLDLDRLDSLKVPVDLARQIETLQSKLTKSQKESSWEAKASEELGFDLDDGSFGPGRKQKKARTMYDDEDDDERGDRKQKQQLAALKANLSHLLASLK